MAASNDPSQRDRAQSWYVDDIKEVPHDMRTLLESYSGIPPSEVLGHVLDVVRAFQFRFASVINSSNFEHPLTPPASVSRTRLRINGLLSAPAAFILYPTLASGNFAF